MPEVVFFKTQKDFRKWLEKNHDKKTEQWVGYYKKSSGKDSIDWPQSVEAALSFGWIDGLRKTIDDKSYKIRFTPRKQGSTWSAINLKKIDELIEKGLMHPAGMKIYQERNPDKSSLYSFENSSRTLDPSYKKKFKANKKAWEYFTSQTPWYQKTTSWWISSAKKEETRLKRLNTLIEDSENHRHIKQLARPAGKVQG